MEKQRWEESEKRREEERRSRKRNSEERRSRCAKQVGKPRNTVFFQWFVAPEGGKVGSLVRSHVIRWEMKSCTPLRREAKKPQPRSTFEMKSVRRCGAKHVSKSKRTKHIKTPHVCATFDVEASFCVAGAKDSPPCQKMSKVSKTWGLCSISKNDGRRGTFEEDLERWIYHGRRSTRDMFIRDVRRSGRWFLERGCILEHQIFRFAKMILRDRCCALYDLASIFRGRRSTLDRWSGTIAKRIGTRPAALHSTFHSWRKSRRIASFLMLSAWKFEEVSQNSFVFRLADN